MSARMNDKPTHEAFSIQREIATLDPDVADTVRSHLDELDAMLKYTSPYALRDDSRLAYRFVTGDVRHMGPWDVVHDMACTQYLCEAMPYQQCQQPYLRALADAAKTASGASWSKVWTAVAELGPELLKCTMMHDLAVRIPDFGPSAPPPTADGVSAAACDAHDMAMAVDADV